MHGINKEKSLVISAWMCDEITYPFPSHSSNDNNYKTASFQREAMRTQVAFYFFYEMKFV